MTTTESRSGEHPGDEAGVTTGFLARKLGVSPTTLRSWDRRYGLGPAARVQGRHRRWSPDDVAMMQDMCRMTAAGVPPAEAARVARRRAVPEGIGAPTSTAGRGPAVEPGSPGELPTGQASAPGWPSPAERPPDGGRVSEDSGSGEASEGAGAGRSGGGLPLGSVWQECRGLARAAVRLDAVAVQEQLNRTVTTYGIITAWEEILAPALHAVGRKWESAGDQYVEVEHLLSWHVSATLRHCYVRSSQAPGRSGEALPVVLACMPGELHTLPLEALSAVLAERGLPVLMLGGAVPAEALVATVRRIGSTAVVLWSQSRSTASLALARHLAATRWGVRGARTHTAVHVCGPGWGAAKHETQLRRPRSLREAVAVLAGDGPSGTP
ncbi:B12 binding domain-containing protein [Streptomyces sp. 1222.5]|uniref:MerR family transcriptional regulator n=1 Tax=unclassified Streptomyces TaxID=2593676 RepID=UPI000895DF1B|nr:MULTISPECIES: MerR family transcriptional regulator [unclassified Streptomyces]PKW05429.1 B12 binding protein [Streptomyces sp. 5112.2]SED39861.1 B12 binding domain-containing protein [Streptomyces sp. 1222.5]